MSELELPKSMQKICPMLSKVMPIPSQTGLGMEVQPFWIACLRDQCAWWNEAASQCSAKENETCQLKST